MHDLLIVEQRGARDTPDVFGFQAVANDVDDRLLRGATVDLLVELVVNDPMVLDEQQGRLVIQMILITVQQLVALLLRQQRRRLPLVNPVNVIFVSQPVVTSDDDIGG